MSDLIDRADEAQAQMLRAHIQQRKPSGPPACGACHNCSSPLAPGLRFCDSECRDDWQRRQDRRGKD